MLESGRTVPLASGLATATDGRALLLEAQRLKNPKS